MTCIRRHLRGVVLVFLWGAWLTVVEVCVSPLLPLTAFFPSTVYSISSDLVTTVCFLIQFIFTRINGAHITVSGDVLPRGESAVVVANHTSWTDFYMIQALAIRAGMVGRCRYFAKTQLRWVPFLGWALWGLGMPMVSRHWDQDQAELDRVFSGIVRHRWPTWLVSFSEATRFTPAKHAESATFCAQSGRPQLKHLLYPRTKGFITTVRHLRQAPHVRAVYDLTIAYQHRTTFHAAPTI